MCHFPSQVRRTEVVTLFSSLFKKGKTREELKKKISHLGRNLNKKINKKVKSMCGGVLK